MEGHIYKIPWLQKCMDMYIHAGTTLQSLKETEGNEGSESTKLIQRYQLALSAILTLMILDTII